MKLTAQTFIGVPPAQVFQMITDLKAAPSKELDPTLPAPPEIVGGGELCEGAILRNSFGPADNRHISEELVVAYQPPYRYATKPLRGGNTEIDFTLEDRPGGTQVSLTLTLRQETEGKESPFLDPRQLQESLRQSLLMMKTALEHPEQMV